MSKPAPNRNQFWADLIVEELVRCGCRTFFAAPGSRSTPLVTAAHRNPAADLRMHFDERGTAFMALGYAKATGGPAAWITTSGTALANGYPAIVEAGMEEVPMVLLTADRPPELRDTDANQTIRQDGMFGRHVRWFMDMPAPTDAIDPEFVLTTVDEAVHRSEKGPVHLNCMYREPLAPSEEPFSTPRTPRFEQWERSGVPFTQISSDGATPVSTLKNLEAMLDSSNRPLIVLGRLSGSGEAIGASAQTLCERYGGVFLADISSQARLGLHAPLGVPHADAILYGKHDPDLEPDLVVQFGATSLSKRLSAFLNRIQPVPIVLVDSRSRRIDPNHTVSVRIASRPVHLLTSLAQRAADSPKPISDWQQKWTHINSQTAAWLNEEISTGALTEQAVSLQLSRSMKRGEALTLGSSNSVRHMDMCSDPTASFVPVLTNRGASGIDGTIASGIGHSMGLGTRPVILLGDLALLHDLNSLALCSASDALVVVVNNDGGGIFSYLPIRDFEDVFEPVFGTPHGRTFEAGAAMFGMTYAAPATVEELDQALESARATAGSTLIEVRTDRQDNLEEVRRLCKNLSERTGS